MLRISFFISISLIISNVTAQVAPDIEWQKSIGGSLGETSQWVQQTADGGIIIAGYAWSHNGDVIGIKGKADIWIVKMDLAGNIEWQKCLGGTNNDVAYWIEETKDGGFVVSGYSRSSDVDLTLNHGLTDYCVFRLDAGGNLLWQKSLGGSDDEWGYPAKECSDGGFIVVGFSKSDDGDVSKNQGDWDYWVVKLNADGNLVWEKALGGTDEDEAYAVAETNEGDFIIVGGTDSNDGDVSGNHGDGDIWIVKLSADGNLIWQKCYGGEEEEYAYAIQKTNDGGFVVVGESTSEDGDVTKNNGLADYWIFKIDGSGNLQWQKSYGGSDYDMATTFAQTLDGGFVVAGDSYSGDGDATTNYGLKDFWVVKLDGSGNLQWQKSLGGSDLDHANSIIQNMDGSYVVTGSSFSNDGNVSGNHGNNLGTSEDYWIVKLFADDESGITSIKNNFLSMYPNPVENNLSVHLSNTNSTIEIFDACGRKVILPTTFQLNKAIINTTEIENGFYSIQIADNKTGYIATGKFVKSE